MNPLSAPPSNENNNNSLAHQAAKASLIVPVLVILLAIAEGTLASQSHNPVQTAVIFDLVGIVLIIGGLVTAILGLAGIPSYGMKGLLGRGLAGLILNSILVLIFGVNFFQASQKAAASRKALQDFRASTEDIRTDFKKSFDPNKGVTNIDIEKVDRLSSQLKNASQNLSGDDARIATVMAGFLDRSRGAMKNYQDAVQQMRDAHVLEKFDPQDKAQFTSKREVVQRFLQANSDLVQVITNAEDNIRADLAKAQVSQANTESVIAGYHSSAGPVNALTLEIRKCDDRVGNAMLDALNTLESQWGKWKVDFATQKLIFNDTETRDAYNKSIIAMRSAADDQVKWQAKLVNRQTAAHP